MVSTLSLSPVLQAHGKDSTAHGQWEESLFARSLQEHRARVYAWCRRYFTSQADVEDAAQETLLRAWMKRSSFRGEAPLSAWLWLVTRTVCLRRCENASARRTNTLDDRAADAAPSPFEQAWRRQMIARIEAQLSPRALTVFRCRYALGLSSHEIARMVPSGPGGAPLTSTAIRSILARQIAPVVRAVAAEYTRADCALDD